MLEQPHGSFPHPTFPGPLPGADAHLYFPSPFVSVTLQALPVSGRENTFILQLKCAPISAGSATSFSWLLPLDISHISDQAEKMFSVRKKCFVLLTASKCWASTVYLLHPWQLKVFTTHTQPCREWFSSLWLVHGKFCQ